jgi:hypothetical protein
MINTIGGIILLGFGLLFAIFHRGIAHRTAGFYYKLLHVHFSERGYQIVFLLVGVGFAIFGLLTVFKVIKFK